ncbi:DUF4124 domain-containing protein [Dyella solisilvae]|uniref:DUF4124 domain-containing protein n=1 Tax=Dyella solisilvae TaxID=1920168 RepID=A0A370KC78_9GAMM|nr:DUF4124 domain-containing protein [Dyella solisilvae]RDJ00249.1 DUF4124 domain-containing protein [Dyella solisilvae]
MRRLLIATALLIAAPMVAAQAYKWTDANGTVHYSDAPPPQGTKYNKVTTTGTVEPLAAPAPSGNSSSETASAKPSQSSQPAQPMADTPENRAKFCSSLKGNLDTLKGSSPVVMEQNGQQKVIDADQRQQQTSTAEAQYKQYCPGT